MIKQHLRSVKDTILNWSSSAGTLQTYCSALNGLVSSDSLANGWLFDEDGLKNVIKRWFASLLVSEQNQTVDLDDATCRKIVNGVRDMIKSQVQTCLVLGDRTHPNINAYLY